MKRAFQTSPQFLRLRTEWTANTRLRLGVWLAFGLFALYAAFLLNDWRQALHEKYQQESLRFYKTAALEGQQVWIARAQQARDLRKALDAQVPTADTLGLAQAEAQSWVQQLLRAFGRDMASQARAPVQVDVTGGIWKIPITVRGVVTSNQYLEMLRRIEGGDRLMVIEQVTIDNQRRPIVEMTISTFYRVRSVETKPGGASASP